MKDDSKEDEDDNDMDGNEEDALMSFASFASLASALATARAVIEQPLLLVLS